MARHWKPALAAAALLTASPALADDLGDNRYRIEAEQTRKAAMRTETLFVIASAADLFITVSCIEAGKCREANPLAKSHSSGKMIAIKSALTVGHFLFVQRLSRRDPKAALRVAQLSAGIQGGVVALNMRVVF